MTLSSSDYSRKKLEDLVKGVSKNIDGLNGDIKKMNERFDKHEKLLNVSAKFSTSIVQVLLLLNVRFASAASMPKAFVSDSSSFLQGNCQVYNFFFQMLLTDTSATERSHEMKALSGIPLDNFRAMESVLTNERRRKAFQDAMQLQKPKSSYYATDFIASCMTKQFYNHLFPPE